MLLPSLSNLYEQSQIVLQIHTLSLIDIAMGHSDVRREEIEHYNETVQLMKATKWFNEQ